MVTQLCEDTKKQKQKTQLTKLYTLKEYVLWYVNNITNSPYTNMLTCKCKLGRNTALTGSGPAYLQIYYGS